MGRRELIIEELLNALDDPGAVDAVLARHSDSKSVLYQAIALVIPIAKQCLLKAVEERAEATMERDRLVDETEVLNSRMERLRDEQSRLEQENRKADEDLTSKEDILAQATALDKAGFNAHGLEQLIDFLIRIATTHKTQPHQIVALFFDLLGIIDRPVALELEVERAEERLRLAEASREEVEDERNALSQEIKVHRSALSALKRLRRQGVMLDSVPSLDRLARKSGVPLNTLLRQLERYGSINKAVAILEKRRRALQGEGEHLKRQIDSLEAEKQGILVEHYEMREDMLILSVGKQRASTEIANLGSIGELARAFLSRDPHEIGQAPPTFPVLLLIWTRGWLETGGQGDRKIPVHLTQVANEPCDPDSLALRKVIQNHNLGVHYTEAIMQTVLA